MAKFLLKPSLPWNSSFGLNPAASMRKVAQRRLEGLLRKVARAAEGGSPSPGGYCGGGGATMK
jgi:hypothetical protein